MGGQSHRSRLNRDMETGGGQQYGQPSAPPKLTKVARPTQTLPRGSQSFDFSVPQGPRGHQGTVVRGSPNTRGVGGRSGRGSPTW